MKNVFAIVIGLLIPVTSWSHSHPKHNMVLIGNNEVYASHIVYKKPHNYQVILALELDTKSSQRYREAKTQYPQNQIIYLLDEMHIGDIASADQLTGTVFVTDDGGQKIPILDRLTINKDRFRVLFFNELPLSLEQ